MKTINLFVFLLILGTTSCTIQKRVFLPGYDIQWKKHKLPEKNLAANNPKTTEPTINSFKTEMDSIQLVDGQIEVEHIDSVIAIQSDSISSIIRKNKAIDPKTKAQEKQLEWKTSVEPKAKEKLDDPDEDLSLKPIKRRVNVPALISFIGSFLTVPALLLIFVEEFLMIVPILWFLTMFALAIIGICTCIMRPEKNIGMVFGVPAVIALSVIFTAVMLILIVGFI